MKNKYARQGRGEGLFKENFLERWCRVGTAVFLLFFSGSCSQGVNRESAFGVDPNSLGLSCTGSCANANTYLTVSDVQQIVAQAVYEAQSEGLPSTVAVTDRVGNVLAVFRMAGANTGIRVDSGTGTVGGLEGASVPDTIAAITKANTASYLSSEGNAFSTRTASQIIQEHFNPGEMDQPSGPLFGVQFSQLPCSDVSRRYGGAGAAAGPMRSPLGLSADPGGFPLYKGGTVVGGVGVVSDGVYGLDRVITDIDRNSDELIAWAATYGFAAPPDRRADRISVSGRFLRFTDISFSDLISDPRNAPSFTSLSGLVGQLVTVNGYYSGSTIGAGAAFAQPASGIRSDALDFPGQDAFVLVDSSNVERFRPRAGTDQPGGSISNSLTVAEVKNVLSQALAVAASARAQIRRPVGSPAAVTISVVDTSGAILGVVRGRDAPVFGFDVSVQKARTASFFSSTGTSIASGPALRGLPNPSYIAAPSLSVSIGSYVSAFQNFVGNPTLLESTGSALALSDRAIGNLSRPIYPDGPSGGSPGPFSKPTGQWSVFSLGLQLDLSNNAIIQHVSYIKSGGSDVGQNCTGIPSVANGLQIFPGSVPIYRGSTLVGAIGVSGDGVDQDDMIAFLGLAKGSNLMGGSITNAPAQIRADILTPKGIRLRYVSCPVSPFNGSSEQNACDNI